MRRSEHRFGGPGFTPVNLVERDPPRTRPQGDRRQHRGDVHNEAAHGSLWMATFRAASLATFGSIQGIGLAATGGSNATLFIEGVAMTTTTADANGRH